MGCADWRWSPCSPTTPRPAWRPAATSASTFSSCCRASCALAGRPSFVRHLWSIAIEIQFYVLCPFLVGWLARRRPKVAAWSLVAGIAASATLMGLLYKAGDPSRAYYGTDTRIHALLIGCLVAVLLPLKPFSGWISPVYGHSQRKNARVGVGV